MEKFLIYSDGEDPVKLTVITAKNAERAKSLYALLVEIKDPDFLEYVYTEMPGIFESDAKGPLYNGFGSERVLRSDLTKEQAAAIFEQNVRDYFFFEAGYANLYLKWLSSEAEPMEDPGQYVVSENFGLIPCSEDTKRRWDDYIRRTHNRWQFPDEMLQMLALAAWPKDRKVVAIKELEVDTGEWE